MEPKCKRVVAVLSRRVGWIEEYHKALKTGTRVEASQLEEAYRLENLLAVLAIVAVRLLNAEVIGPQPAQTNLWSRTALEPEALEAVERPSWVCPAGGWTYRSTLIAVARLGGFPARTAR